MPDTATEIIFVDEPPPRSTRGRNSLVIPWLDSLRSHPGRWAKYPEPFLSHGGHAKRLVAGQRYGVAPGEFEAVQRSIGNKRYELYARYIGTVTPPSKNGTGT